ncbi:transferase [Trypanosoma rangeli]|uniref:Transferase n=1 Tax=Trypanosoma rangeli TaxID=5698 RepID=A0A422N0J5_TRYRA|nr:transferase [Trypanosoma rangeli]RNE98980.1 transferase [Trypanosoma rangeli]|eukprot:RNE98980.1 transferase [Trypanosoma rangeli]
MGCDIRRGGHSGAVFNRPLGYSGSHSDEQQVGHLNCMKPLHAGVAMDGITPSPVHLAISYNSQSLQSIIESQGQASLLGAKTLKTNTATANTWVGGGVERNKRRGSKIVCGYSTDTKVMCAVRAFLVDKALLEKLGEVVAQTDFTRSWLIPENSVESILDSSGGERVDDASTAASGSNASPNCPVEGHKEDAGKGVKNSGEWLSTAFFLRLRQRLEKVFLHPTEKAAAESTNDVVNENEDILFVSSSSAHPPHSLICTDTILEAGDNAHQLSGNTGRNAVSLNIPPLSTHSGLMSLSVGASSPTGSLRVNVLGEFTGAKTMSDSVFQADTVNVGDLDERDSAYAADWRLPIVGVSIIPLEVNEAGKLGLPPASVKFSEKQRTKMNAAATTTTIAASSRLSVKPVVPATVKPIPQVQRKVKRNSKPTEVFKGSGAPPQGTSSGKATAASRGVTHTNNGTRARVARGRAGHGPPRSSHVDLNTVEDGGLGMSFCASGSTDRIEASPLFAIALSMPLVHQGCIYDVFQSWVCATRPSQLLRETAIRNIINAVLQQLVVLHRGGGAHGSLKATNIFVASHVGEALDTMKPLHTERTAPLPVSSGVGGANDLWRGMLLDTTEVGTRDVDAVSRSSCSCSSTQGIGEDEGAGAAAGAGGVCTGSTGVLDPLEWTKHVVLADGYYAQVEKILMEALTQSADTAVSALDACRKCVPLKSDKECQSSVIPETAMSEGAGVELDELHLFTLQESEYVPPPECITSEEDVKNGSAVNARDMSSQPEFTKGAATGSVPPFRTTNNTRDPRCSVSPSHDIWMLAMLAIHLADGGCPWWMKRHHSPLPRLRCGPWSLRFASFVQRCACADPAQRPSAEELLQDKWFHTSLLEENGNVASSSPARLSSQQILLGGSSSSTPIPPRRPCRRAFHDLMLEYQEYAEDWCARLSRAATDAAAVRKGPFPDSTQDLGGSIVANATANDAPQLEMTTGLEPDCPRLLLSRSGNSSQGSSGSSRGSSTSSCSCRSNNRRFRSGNKECMSRTSLRGNMRSQGGFAAGTDSYAGDGHSLALPQTTPFFIGAMGVALELCGAEASLNAEDADPEACAGGGVGGGNNNPVQEGFSRNCDPIWGPNIDVYNENRRLIGELMQAFWNLHRECRLAADLWCANLMKHMSLDGRTVELVVPLITEETLPFFALPDGVMHALALDRNNALRIATSTPASVSQQESLGASAPGKPLPAAALQQQQLTPGSPPAHAPLVGVSPTAFHNYMFCKWCITTSWALQQDDRCGGNEGRR